MAKREWIRSPDLYQLVTASRDYSDARYLIIVSASDLLVKIGQSKFD